MGANAQTTVPTFTSGQVLTADQQNQSARTGVPVFAGTVERDAAFGGTGEKTLAEGQLCYLESTNVVQYYDGAAWATVGPQTLSSGLNFITGAAFTTATSFSLPDDTFSTTYNNYKFIVNITAVTADANFTMRLRASGSDNTTSNYFYTMGGFETGGTASNSVNGSQSSFVMGSSDETLVRYAAAFDIIAPKQTATTKLFGNYTTVTGTPEQQGRFGVMGFVLTTAFDSLSFISSVASSITGTYRVYGYADS